MTLGEVVIGGPWWYNGLGVKGDAMGLDIYAISRAKRVKRYGYEACFFPLGPEGLKTGYHVPGKGGQVFHLSFGYSAYALWFDELYQIAHGADARKVAPNCRRFPGKPFIEFSAMPSLSQGDALGPKTCAKLYRDFVAYAPRAKEHFAKVKDMPDGWKAYRDFRKACRIAADGGFLCYW